jgi:3-oxoacyl-[acyl-carrier-protein] synthase-3
VYSQIIGTGSYLPDTVVTNADLEKTLDTSDEWIRTRSGISSRRIAAKNETSAFMGAIAAQRALQQANLSAQDIELIVVATATPDRIFPSTACTIQHLLGCKDAAAFDVSAACSGFIYALSIADQYIRTQKYKHVLVVGAEVLSKVVDWADRATCVLFGDGAGAVVLGASEAPGIIDTHLEAMGEYADVLYLANACLPYEPPPHKIKMQGKDVFKLAVNCFSELVETTLEKNNIDKQAIDWLIPHQANIRIIEALAKRLDLPLERVLITLQEQGNTSAASIPLALDAAIRAGDIQRGQLLLLAAFGGGITWASALINY